MVSIKDSSICVQCTLADNSPAKGCHVIAVTNSATTCIDITRQDNSTSIEECLFDIHSGVYNITIYDINADGNISTTPVTVYVYNSVITTSNIAKSTPASKLLIINVC